MPELLKDSIFSKQSVLGLSDLVKKHYSQFDENKFLDSVFNKEWGNLELKQRMRHITICLRNEIKLDYKKSIKILDKISEEYSGFAAMVLADFIEIYGLEDFATSKAALKKYTSCCSSEFAVRPFIIKYKEEMMDELYKWSKDKNHHVRRLSSEGCRPRLPWAIALPEFKKDPTQIIPILEELKNDETEYVRKSVANNLNDISKDNPKVVLDICENWFGKTKNTDWIVKHGLRTLLKKGNERALNLFSISKDIKVEVINLEVAAKRIKINNYLEFSFNLVNKENQDENFRLEYKIDFLKSNGSHSGKVFKIAEIKLQKNEMKNFKRRFAFMNRTTRKLYTGKHFVTILINGIEKNRFEILLED